jgi:AraC family transcriptional regulator of adaptative response/methylated-DNA-[protein]-cysteine methyltransferase
MTSRATDLPIDDLRWNAVLARDRAWDEAFVYGVTSTGVFCRPSCPSRRPRRSVVRFFEQAELAERAGFRACRRCKPTASPGPDPVLTRVERACRYIREHCDERITLASLGRHVGGSPHHLQRTFSRVVGVSPQQYAEACRVGRFKAELKEGKNVTTAMYGAGYGSSSRLYEKSDRALGMTPATYRRGGLGVSMRYTILDSPLGRLLVAATMRGISSVKLGDSDAALESELRREYPSAALTRDDRRLSASTGVILQHLAGARPSLSLPVDVQATAFQWRVWRQLQAIPYGQTRSYGDVARRLGRPTAARAVAQACARNPVALVIPCHRVVSGDGTSGGYRWGVERKKALLEQERRRAAPSAGRRAG